MEFHRCWNIFSTSSHLWGAKILRRFHIKTRRAESRVPPAWLHLWSRYFNRAGSSSSASWGGAVCEAAEPRFVKLLELSQNRLCNKSWAWSELPVHLQPRWSPQGCVTPPSPSAIHDNGTSSHPGDGPFISWEIKKMYSLLLPIL